MFKNEEDIKAKIVEGHKRGVCDGNGASIKTKSGFIAKPMSFPSVAKTYVYREGRMVLKNG